MLSIARSRYTVATQFSFLAFNALGLVFGAAYNARTPDLYPNNAHHKLGWAFTWFLTSQVVIGLLGRVAETIKGRAGSGWSKSEREGFIPISTAAMAEHHRLGEALHPRPYRLSNDSGQGTEPNTDSLRSHSVSTAPGDAPAHTRAITHGYGNGDGDGDGDGDEDEDVYLRASGTSARLGWWRVPVVGRLLGLLSSRVWRILRVGYAVVDRVILIMGFVLLCTGVIAYGRFFVCASSSAESLCESLTRRRRRAMRSTPG